MGVQPELRSYKSIRQLTIFSSGKYLFNQWVRTASRRGVPSPEAIMSVPDQYLWQAGLGYSVPECADGGHGLKPHGWGAGVHLLRIQ
jgi:hypothetical protein